MHFIKAIFLSKKISEGAHYRFMRYGRGEFNGPSITIKKAGNLIKINGSVDYVSAIGKIISEFSESCECSGKIIARAEIHRELEKFVEVGKSKSSGFFVYEIKGFYSGKTLLQVYENFLDENIFLDLSSSNKKFLLKSKKNLPKPGKVDENFFSAILDMIALSKLSEEIAFDVSKTFNELKLSHKYLIKELVVPEEFKNDFKEARIRAKRKGIVKRILEVGDVKEETEKEFLV